MKLKGKSDPHAGTVDKDVKNNQSDEKKAEKVPKNGHRITGKSKITPAGPDRPRQGIPRKTSKVRKRAIKPRSKKQQGIMKALRSAYPAFLERHPMCAIQSPVCTGKATCVHHKAGRGKNVVLDQKTWEPCCVPCNSWIEQNDRAARDNGHKVSRLQKPENK